MIFPGYRLFSKVLLHEVGVVNCTSNPPASTELDVKGMREELWVDFVVFRTIYTLSGLLSLELMDEVTDCVQDRFNIRFSN